MDFPKGTFLPAPNRSIYNANSAMLWGDSVLKGMEGLLPPKDYPLLLPFLFPVPTWDLTLPSP